MEISIFFMASLRKHSENVNISGDSHPVSIKSIYNHICEHLLLVNIIWQIKEGMGVIGDGGVGYKGQFSSHFWKTLQKKKCR